MIAIGRTPSLKVLALLAAFAIPGSGRARAADVDGVVVVANTNVPGSLEVARHYMAMRGIPADHLLVAALPGRESISRYVYEKQLRDPLLAFLRDRNLAEQVLRDKETVRDHESPWTTVRARAHTIVLAYGVPLRIVDTRPAALAKVANWIDGLNLRDSAAVESELALLLHGPYEIRGTVRNPLFNALYVEDLSDRAAPILMACRVDGPDAATAKRLVDDAIWAEKNGLGGRGYFDALGTPDRGYAQGDHWIIEACERIRREGFECALDRTDAVWGNGYPMEQAAMYFGWYAEHAVGPFLRPDFRFQRGAIAYHIHSTSARSLRTTAEHWAGPLLARGAAVTMGAVDEPYLGLTIDLQRFADRLAAGLTLGEAWCLSLPVFSWQMALVGDPLYRPFGRSLETLIADTDQGRAEGGPWPSLRRMNLMVREGRVEPALAYARLKMEHDPTLVLRERFAEVCALNERTDEALDQYAFIAENAATAETAVRAGLRCADLMRSRGRTDDAVALEAALRKRWSGSPCLSLLGP
jgi:uncharacterized protein (TIGR03790 family)